MKLEGMICEPLSTMQNKLFNNLLIQLYYIVCSYLVIFLEPINLYSEVISKNW